MENLLLIIVVALVLALLWIINKLKESKEGATAKSDSADRSRAISSTASTHKEEEKTSDSPQNTIYEFAAESGKTLCPWCDGENSVDTKVCNICGGDIKTGKE